MARKQWEPIILKAYVKTRDGIEVDVDTHSGAEAEICHAYENYLLERSVPGPGGVLPGGTPWA